MNPRSGEGEEKTPSGTEPMSRKQHMEWAKKRALATLEETNDVQETWNSFCIDLSKHDQASNNIGILIGAGKIADGKLSTVEEMKKFIQGFN